MPEPADALPAAEAARRVLQRLRAGGFEALFAGGCVRDRLLGKQANDYDVATSARPAEVRRLFRRTVAVGEQFGVVIVAEFGPPVEVATFRRDKGYRDGRHPEGVEFADVREDARRRDFTVNGLFLDPETGRVLDFVGGEADLAARVVRAIGDPSARFEEDRLRMIRAARFAAALGFSLDPATAEAARRLAAKVASVSWERIRDEVKKMLTGPAPKRSIELLDALGLLCHVLPELLPMKGCEQPANFHPEGDVWVHTLLCFDHLRRDPPFPLALGLLLHDVGKPRTFKVEDRIRFTGHEVVGARMAETVCERLRLSNDEKDRVVDLVKRHMALKDIRAMRPGRAKNLVADAIFPDLLDLTYADTMASHRQIEEWEHAKGLRARWSEEELKPPPLLTGHDLIAAGLAPGPVFKRILEAVRLEQLDGSISTPDQALALARRIAAEPYNPPPGQGEGGPA